MIPRVTASCSVRRGVRAGLVGDVVSPKPEASRLVLEAAVACAARSAPQPPAPPAAPAGRQRLPRAPRAPARPYVVVAISAYLDDLAAIDAEIVRRKAAGDRRASRSGLIREALSKLGVLGG